VTAFAPYVQDAVITGHDRNEIGALVFLTEAARKLDEQSLRASLKQAFATLKAQSRGSSQTPTRLLLLTDSPSMAAGEITDKGYINQRMVLQRRSADVEALYAAASDPRVLIA
jgi:feruloyl-CoA synthase